MMKARDVTNLQVTAEDPATLLLIRSHEKVREKLNSFLSNCEEIRNDLLVSKRPTTAVDTLMGEIRKELE